MATAQQRVKGHWFPRAVAAFGGLVFLIFGLWAMIAPQSFFDSVAVFEPYNQHFVQDIGAFQIGLGAVLALAWFSRGAEPSRSDRLVRASDRSPTPCLTSQVPISEARLESTFRRFS
ncbi:MAG: hypothetical protein WEB55_03255 [Acidimicrobiia bacterium]